MDGQPYTYVKKRKARLMYHQPTQSKENYLVHGPTVPSQQRPSTSSALTPTSIGPSQQHYGNSQPKAANPYPPSGTSQSSYQYPIQRYMPAIVQSASASPNDVHMTLAPARSHHSSQYVTGSGTVMLPSFHDAIWTTRHKADMVIDLGQKPVLAPIQTQYPQQQVPSQRPGVVYATSGSISSTTSSSAYSTTSIQERGQLDRRREDAERSWDAAKECTSEDDRQRKRERSASLAPFANAGPPGVHSQVRFQHQQPPHGYHTPMSTTMTMYSMPVTGKPSDTGRTIYNQAGTRLVGVAQNSDRTAPGYLSTASTATAYEYPTPRWQSYD